MFEFMTIRELYEIIMSGSYAEQDSTEHVQLQDWVRINRCSGKLGFIELNGGTCFRNVQLMYLQELKNLAEVEKYPTGAAITATEKFVLTPQGKQPLEIQVTEASLEGDCDCDYPSQKKRHSSEYLREIAHLRPRANSFYAIFRPCSVLPTVIYKSFQDQGFVYVRTPIITGNDGEGAGEMLKATIGDDADYEQDFSGKEVLLTAIGRLHVGAFVMAFRDVYIFGPAFRVESSNTNRHANESQMIEPEIAFVDPEDGMNLIEDMVKYCIDHALENVSEEMKLLNTMIDKSCAECTTKVRNSDFKRMTYMEATDLLLQADVKFDNRVEWGMDLNSEHERYICEKIMGGPVFLTDYPKEIKAFYICVNDDGKIVAARDLLAPGAGELVGGSQREERYDVLEARMKDMGTTTSSLQWYMNLRRYGGRKYTSFGLGFDRLLTYLIGMQNIHDVESFPRTPKNLLFQKSNHGYVHGSPVKGGLC